LLTLPARRHFLFSAAAEFHDGGIQLRFVPAACLRQGMVNGKDLWGQGGLLLLRQGHIITDTHIARIVSLGYFGVYIADNLSKDIEIEGVIDDNLRQRTSHAIKNIFIQSEKTGNPQALDVPALKRIAEELVDNILSHQHLMVNMIDLKIFDDYTFVHSVNVAVLAVVLGIALDMGKDELTKLCLGGLLHDIGKVFIPKHILNKNGRLTAEEFSVIQAHSEQGYKYLKNNWEIPVTAQNAVLYHHEKYNGTGYPEQKKAGDISLFGRILGIADVYDALVSERPYRKALLPSEAIEYLLGNAGSHFDPDLVRLFVRKVAPYPLGTCVTLSTGQNAIVVENYENFCTRPKVKIIDDSPEDTFIRLADDYSAQNITITAIANI